MNIFGDREDHDSPCIGECSTTNLGTDICTGCGRNAIDVIYWNSYSKEERIKINKSLKDKGNNDDKTK